MSPFDVRRIIITMSGDAIDDAARAERAREREEDRIFQRTLHEDRLLNDRLNSFLIFESVLVAAGGALLATRDQPPSWAFVVLALFGISITWLWHRTQHRQLVLVRALVTELESFADEVKRVEMRARGKVETGMRTGSVLAYWLPWIALLLWVVVLAVAVSKSV